MAPKDVAVVWRELFVKKAKVVHGLERSAADIRLDPNLVEPKGVDGARREPEVGQASYVQFIGKQGFCQLLTSSTTGPHGRGGPAVKHLRDEVEKGIICKAGCPWGLEK